jgi:DegV family protein with EDD domain
MKTAVVIDSACDLPVSYIRRHPLHLLPNTLILGDQILIDTRDVNLTLAFHHRYARSRNLEVATKPCSASAIAGLFLDRLVSEYDRAILIAISQTHSALFQNATEASFAILRGYRARRRQAGLNTPFYLNVLDSKTVFAGQAVLVHEVVRLLQNQDLPFNELRGLIEEFRRHIRCYLLFDDLSYVRHQASGKGENRVGFLNYGLGSLLGIKSVARFVNGETEWVLKARGFDRALSDLFELAKLEIDQGLRNPLVVLSYAGDPQLLEQKRAVVEFERHVRQWGVEVMVSVMSATGGLHVGPGAVSLAFATA